MIDYYVSLNSPWTHLGAARIEALAASHGASLRIWPVDFGAIFSKMAANDFAGWAVLEWECCIKHPEDGAREGAQFIKDHIIRVTPRAFDDFAASGTDEKANRRLLGLDR
jgi:hypothetical protein